MNCTEIQERILNEPGLALVDAHLRQCCDCRAFWEAAAELDAALSITLKSPKTLNRAVFAAITSKPTYLPELLDFVGWAAMLAVIIGVAGKLLAT
jgi:predicted anti-sigma-YlaC factor YlaD